MKIFDYWFRLLIEFWFAPLFLIVGILVLVIPDATKSKKEKVSSVIVGYEIQDYHGKVIDKYTDKADHAYKKVILKLGNDWSSQNGGPTQRTLYFRGWAKNNDLIYDYIKLGDSLVKKPNSLEIKIYRNNFDTAFTFEFYESP